MFISACPTGIFFYHNLVFCQVKNRYLFRILHTCPESLGYAEADKLKVSDLR